MTEDVLLQFLHAHRGQWDDAGHLRWPPLDLARWTALCARAPVQARRAASDVMMAERERRWTSLARLTAHLTREEDPSVRRALRDAARALQRDILQPEPLEWLALGLRDQAQR